MVSAPTVKAYYQILEDTLIGNWVPVYRKRPQRGVILAPKFYFFDVGVVGFLTRRGRGEEGSELFGRALEHFLYMELTAHRRYSALLYPISYWRMTYKFGDIVFVGITLAKNVVPIHLHPAGCFSSNRNGQ